MQNTGIIPDRVSTVVIMLLWLAAISCAKVGSLSGGPKDETPPVLTEAFPAMGAVSVRPREVKMEFNEFFQLKNPGKNVIITPSLKQQAEFKVQGKTLTILLGDSLKENTTYSIAFGDALQDITENNVLENFQYVFSTGTYLDSMRLSGTVLDALEATPAEEIWVLLYQDDADSLPLTRKPDYLTRTDENGRYDFRYLRNTSYSLYALEDKNGNYYFDQPNERFAFFGERVQPVSDSVPDPLSPLRLFLPAPEKTGVSRFRLLRNSLLHVQYNHPVKVDSVWKIHGDTTAPPTFFQFPDADSLSVYFTPALESDSIAIGLSAGGIRDTITVFKSSVRKSDTTLYQWIRHGFAPNDALWFRGNFPFRVADTNAWAVVNTDTTAGYDTIVPGLQSLSPQHLKVTWMQEPGNSYQVWIFPGGVVDASGNPIRDTLNFTWKEAAEDYYGTLKVTVDSLPDKGYARLYPEKSLNGPFIPVARTGNVLSTNAIPPGKYILKFFHDGWKNGKWNTGNYVLKQQPETVYRYPDIIHVRSNWDLETTWKLSE